MQQSLMMQSPVASRETEHFRMHIGRVTSASELVADRQILSVALGAFGLSPDLPNRHFIQKVLESDPGDPHSLAAKLADSRYAALADAFGFGAPGTRQTSRPGFAEEIISAYQARQFEAAVGNEDPDMRLALGLERELNGILERISGKDARWYAVLGTPPLRAVFETAFGFPDSIGALDIDRQAMEFRKLARTTFGTDDLGLIAQSETLDDLRRRFLLRAAAEVAPQASPALMLLRGTSGTSPLEILYSRLA
jgi:hypothetical protein